MQWRSATLPDGWGLRPVDRADLHVTLCFLGWRDPTEVEAIARVCASVVDGRRGMGELGLGPAIWLPRRRPRVLAVEVVDHAGWLRGRQSELASALERGGFYQPERRRFRPHVTVARVPRGAPPQPRELSPPRALRLSPAGITLFCSTLSAAGARYTALARMPSG